jgi:putative phage-type endonuclease
MSSDNYNLIHSKVKQMNETPQVAQRTAEWYEMRKKMITASEVGSFLGVSPYKSRRMSIREKMSILRDEPQPDRKKSFMTDWGVKYEPIVQNMIAHKYRPNSCYPIQNVLFEYGLIQHPTIHVLGASPDGILYNGRMVEIKCVVSREIMDNEIPAYYYSQIQTQLECCGFDDCDYVECRFTEYANKYEFLKDQYQDKLFLSADQKPKGIIAIYSSQPNEFIDQNNITDNIDDWFKKHSSATKFVYWKCETFSSKIIQRNHEYISKMLFEIENTWEHIMKYHTNIENTCEYEPVYEKYHFENFITENGIIVKNKDHVSVPDITIPNNENVAPTGKCMIKLTQ